MCQASFLNPVPPVSLSAPPPPLEVPEVESPSKEGLGRSFKHFVTPLNTVKSFSINDKKQLMEVPPRVSQCLTLAQFWEFLRDSRVTNRDLTLGLCAHRRPSAPRH